MNLQIREDTEFGIFILTLGGYHYHDYGWQVKIPNLKAFFALIKPILERRIENSPFKGLTNEVKISNYKEIIELGFKNGKITTIKRNLGYPAELSCDLKIPGTFIYKILLADCSFEELKYIVKDCEIEHDSKYLINILFPKLSSYPDTYY
jgi:hypothetical protein